MRIYTIENKDDIKIIRKKTSPVDLKKAEKKTMRELIKEMRATMKNAQGIGLSANQIGLSSRMFVAEVPDEESGRNKFYALFNPEIKKYSEETINMEEGCLSVPGSFGMVERPEKVVLEGYDLNGKKIKIKAWGLLARVFQHELDHLNGKLFIEKAKDLHKTDTQEKIIK